LQFAHVILKLEKVVNPPIDIKYRISKAGNHYNHFR